MIWVNLILPTYHSILYCDTYIYCDNIAEFYMHINYCIAISKNVHVKI